MLQGFNAFKMKVGRDLNDDKRRANIIRKEIGKNGILMMDANQVWDVKTAIKWMYELSIYNIAWIEEPTSPDDIMGHLKIKNNLKKLNIGVATGEHCQNTVMFKQLIEMKSLDFVQCDCARLCSIPELLMVCLLANKFNLPICPHAGGVGLNEMARHLIFIDFILINNKYNFNNILRICEYAQHLDSHFIEGATHKHGTYFVFFRFFLFFYFFFSFFVFMDGNKNATKQKGDITLPIAQDMYDLKNRQ